jgi:hypothetical protein
MTTLRRRVAVAALLLLVPTLAACGFGEQTDAVYQAATGVNSRTGQVWILNALIVSSTDGTGTFAGSLVNESQTKPATLVSVSSADGNVSVKVPAGSLVDMGRAGAVRLTDSAITPGSFVPLTFTFDNGQIVKVDMPVVEHSGDYAAVPVGALPSPTPTSSPSKKPTKAKKHGSSTPSSTATPTS